MIYLDIETCSGFKDYYLADKRTQDLWYLKFRHLVLEALAKNPIINESEFVNVMYKDKAALYSEFNKIVCVSLGMVVQDKETKTDKLHIKSSSSDNEIDILRDIATAIKSADTLVGHNGKAFDFPMLSRKYLIHGLQLPVLLQNSGRKPWEVPLIDTQEMWKFGDLRYTVSLDQLAMVFNLPSPKANMHGSQVSEYYYAGRLKEIVQYCELDVATLINVHRKMIGQPIVTELHGGEPEKQEELFK